MKVAKQCRKKVITGRFTKKYLICIHYKAPDYKKRFIREGEPCMCTFHNKPIRDIEKCDNVKY